MEIRGGENPINLIAVDVSKFCKCHRLVLGRENDDHRWFYFFVKEPSRVEFGDLLRFYSASRSLFLTRGPTLSYRVFLDSMPDDMAEDLALRLPYSGMYPNGPYKSEFWPPQN